MVVTCGEDGHVRVWTGADELMKDDAINTGNQVVVPQSDTKSEKGRKGKSKARFKPY